MKFFGRYKKEVAVRITWRDSHGKTKSIMRQVVSRANNVAIIMYPNGQQVEVKVFAVKRGTIFGQFLPNGKYGVPSEKIR